MEKKNGHGRESRGRKKLIKKSSLEIGMVLQIYFALYLSIVSIDGNEVIIKWDDGREEKMRVRDIEYKIKTKEYKK